ncbi:MAG: transketolase [Pirellulales bacterium]
MTAADTSKIDQLAINTIRTLSMDAVQAAVSGHPGTPMALAPVAYQLWQRHLRFDPADPTWPARDRFVLSCGHASMLLYSLLHLAGVRQVDHDGRVLDEPAVSLDQARRFRQLHSRTPGHPEYRDTGGVETTTGPLGQGIGNSVGMAIAGKWLAARYDRPGYELFGFDTYALCSDGDLMEGVGSEAASLAGHLKLDNLCWIYDDNGITIEGHTDLAFSEEVATRFTGYGWHVIQVNDANDLAALDRAYAEFKQTTAKPTIVIVRSVIGFGSPNKANSHDAHGAALGEEEVRLTKKAYGWPEDKQFFVPPEATQCFADGVGKRGREAHAAWNKKFADYRAAHAELAAEWETMRGGKLPVGWDAEIPAFVADAKGVASRVSSGKVLNAVAKHLPWLIGGSADLAPSNNTMLTFDGAGEFNRTPSGRNFHFGIREHGMAAALNGMALCGLRPYGGTFFVFTDYMRPSIRLASIMRLPVLYVLTHDSIGLGEDGPTHQPVEHLAACRAIPNLLVMRPGDANEVAEAYRTILPIHDRPVALVLSRQNLPTLDRTKFAAASGVRRGGYTLLDAPGGKPDVILIGTGSELSLAVAAGEQLATDGVKVRVVSLPCWELFDEQDAAYRESVLPPSVTARVAVEAGIEQGWHKYLGDRGRFVGMTSFGASSPAGELYKHFGITAEHIVEQAKAALK